MNLNIINELLKNGIIKFNFKKPFTFKSGLRSPIYCNLRETSSYPFLMKWINKEFMEMIPKDFSIDGVMGVSTGATQYSTVLGMELDVPFGYVRPGAKIKDYGMKNLIEGIVDVKDKHIILIEDLISTGGSVLGDASIIRQAGSEEIFIMSIFSYNMEKAKENFANAGFEYRTIIDFHELVHAAHTSGRILNKHKDLLFGWSQSPETWFERNKEKFESEEIE
jgi:orotate phosphoribosyltransferase